MGNRRPTLPGSLVVHWDVFVHQDKHATTTPGHQPTVLFVTFLKLNVLGFIAFLTGKPGLMVFPVHEYC